MADFDRERLTSSGVHMLKAWCEDRLSKYRETNDSDQLTDGQTALLRGRIKEVKSLLKQLEPPEKG